MSPYLVETRYASEGLVVLLTREEQKLARAQQLAKQFKDRAREIFDMLQQQGPDSQLAFELVEMEMTAERFRTEEKQILQALSILPASLDALAGALLQIAKQGISMVHGGLGACPPGRVISGVQLKDLVWQGRNQSMHFEEGRFTPAVQACFAQLSTVEGAQFQLGRRNLAHAVVQLLGWTNYAQYEHDMTGLLP